MSSRVAVIGGGISGIACAASLADSGVEVDLFDRGHRLGGRLAALTLRETGTPSDGHVVDVGAAYLTASDAQFTAVVDDWIRRGMARPWTDTFHVSDGRGLLGTKLGPVRYAAPQGLRSLVEDLALALPRDLVTIAHPHDVTTVVARDDGALVDGVPYRAVALCNPGPQAARLTGQDPDERWEPVLSLVAVYGERTWPGFDGVFVNDDPVVTFVADDGARRGDGAPVLVAHSSPVLAAAHLADPMAAAPAMLASLGRLTGAAEPDWFTVKRWSLARPLAARPEACSFDGVLGRAGDAWAGGPRTEAAWVSGTALGRAIASSVC